MVPVKSEVQVTEVLTDPTVGPGKAESAGDIISTYCETVGSVKAGSVGDINTYWYDSGSR